MADILFTFIFINHCTIENKEPAERKELPNPFSCGTYVSKVYPREHRIERHPDLGMVLLEDKLELTPNQIKSLRKAAASCTLRCQVRKEEISRLTQELHLSLTRKEYLSGNLSRLAYQLNKIDNQKTT